MSFLKKFLPLIGITLSLSTFAAEEKSLISLSDDPVDDNSLSRLFKQQLTIDPLVFSNITLTFTENVNPNVKILEVGIKDGASKILERTHGFHLRAPFKFLMNFNNEGCLFHYNTLYPNAQYNISAPAPKKLSINNIDFNVIPPTFINLSFLKSLSFYECNMQGKISSKNLPQSIPGQKLPSLERIKIFGSSLNTEGTEFLETLVPGVKKLWLQACSMDVPSYLSVLKKASSSVKTLKIIGPEDKIPQEVLEFLFSSGNFPCLTSLYIGATDLSGYDFSSPFGTQNLPKLTHLSLVNTKLNDAHLFSITQRFPLETLNLTSNKFTHEGIIKAIEDSKNLHNLKKLKLYHAKWGPLPKLYSFTKEEQKAFYEAFSNWGIKNNRKTKLIF